MVKYFPLKAYFQQGVSYETPKRLGYKIVAIGTDQTTDVYLKIDGKDTGKIKTLVAPPYKYNSNLLGPLELGKLYYAIPPETKFTVEGPSGALVSVLGQQVILDPGEPFPAELLARSKVQHLEYRTYVEKTYSHGTDVTFVADDEVKIYELTPLTIEKYLFNGPIMFSIANYTLTARDIALRFRMDGAELDMLDETGYIGPLDTFLLPRPPAEAKLFDFFSLAVHPIEVLGDHTFQIWGRNISGGAISPATGTSLEFTVTAIVDYYKSR